MPRTITFILLLLPIIFHAQNFKVISSTSLRIQPDSKSKVILRVQAGNQGKVLDRQKWWTKVNFRGYKGYIKTANLKFFPTENPTVSPNHSKPTFEKNENTNPAKKPFEENIDIHKDREIIKGLNTEIDNLKSEKALLSEELNNTKKELELKNKKLLSTELDKKLVENELEITREKLELSGLQNAETLQDIDSQENEKPSTEHSFFRKMLDVSAGIAVLVEDNYQEVANGFNMEVKYALSSSKGFGFEGGLNFINLSELNKFTPFINPFLGISYGRYDSNIAFSVAPRVYLFTNPFLSLEDETEITLTTTKVTPSVMFGFGTNLRFKLNKKLALTLIGSYMRGAVKLKETGTKSGESFTNNTKNNLSIFGAGLGISFKL